MVNERALALYDILTAESSSEDQKIQHLTKFKGHVKKELVHEQSIPKYFECLCSTMQQHLNEGNHSARLFVLSHSTLCYLVKRVAMQSPAQFDAVTVQTLIAPLLRTVHSEKKVWSASVKALEAIFLAQPSILEQALEASRLEPKNRVAALLFIDELVQLHQKNNRNPLEILNKFTSLFLSILNEPANSESQDNELIKDILGKYYTTQSMQDFSRRIKHPDVKKLFEVRPELPIEQVYVNTETRPPPSTFDMDAELRILLKDQPKTPVPAKPKNYSSLETLRKDLEQLAAPFASHKETEHNWRQRQETVITLRSIIAGNVAKEYGDELIALFKELQLSDCISKAVSSLRTSLSIHGCHLVREMADQLQENIDPIAEGLFNSLKGVLSATKKIASQNAFTTACMLLASMQFHSRIFQSCFMLSKDKNASPRCFGAVFLRIFVIRFYSKLDNCLIYIDEWIHRSITDAQTKIREAMRTTFWYYYKVYPTNAKRVLDGLPPHFRRAVESSIPPNLEINYTTSQVNSSDSSRRSSLGPSRAPSYAGPTHSSHPQRLSALRSSSEYNSSYLTGRSSPLAPLESRKVSAPVGFTSRTAHDSLQSRRQTPPAPIQDTQIDLTAEITQNHSNTLLKKYAQEQSKDPMMSKHSEKEMNDIYKHLSSQDSNEVELGLQLLRNVIVVGIELGQHELSPILRQIMIKNPQSLKELLRVSQFLDLLTIPELIEAFAINHVPCEKLIERFGAVALIEGVSILLKGLYPSDKGLALYYVRFRQLIFDYAFEVLIKVFDTPLSLSNKVLESVTISLLDVYGNDFELREYFNALFKIFSNNRKTFLDLLEESPVFLKLKVGRELEKRDPSFHCDFLVQRAVSPKPALDEEMRHMELTMVNPLQKTFRSSSADSVVIHPIENDENQNDSGGASMNSEDNLGAEEVQGFTKFGGLSKLTEMTRVVSLYEKQSLPSASEELHLLDRDGDHKMSRESTVEKSKTPDVDLSDIFKEQPTQKGTLVTFRENPSTFGQHEPSLNETLTKKHSKFVESPNNSSETLKELVSIDSSGEAAKVQGNPAGQEISNPRINSPDESASPAESSISVIKEKSVTSTEYNILASVEKSSLLEFELKTILVNSCLPYRLGSLIAVTGKIKKGSFTIKDINLMIFFLLVGGQEESLHEWLWQTSGFSNLIGIQQLLLESITNSTDFSEALAVRCLLFSSCLVVIELANTGRCQQQENISTREAWACISSILRRIDSFTDECYLLSEDLRGIILRSRLAGCERIDLLSTELKDIEARGQVIAAFTLESTNQLSKVCLYDLDVILFGKVLLSAKSCASNTVTEVRKASLDVLKTLQARATMGEFKVLFESQVSTELTKLISSL